MASASTTVRLWVGCLALLYGFALQATRPAAAQVARPAGGNASAQVLQQYQQASAERAALQAENLRMKQELDALKAKLKATDRQLSDTRGSATRSQNALAAAQAAARSSEQALEQNRARLQELITRFKDTTATLGGVETDRAQTRQQLVAMNAQYDLCAQRNFELYELNAQALDRLDHPGAFAAFTRIEPFTRLQRTRMENLVDDYRARALELRVRDRPVDATGSAAIPKN